MTSLSPVGDMHYPVGVIPWVICLSRGSHVPHVYPVGDVIPWVTVTHGITTCHPRDPYPVGVSRGHETGLLMQGSPKNKKSLENILSMAYYDF